MNAKLKTLLVNYSESHQSKINQKIHKFAIPLIIFSFLGLLSQISLKQISLSWFFILLLSFYYLQFKSLIVFIVIYLQIIPMMILISYNPLPAIPFYTIIFVLAWTAQFIGHKIEGKKPSFFQDLQYLLIGPLWILKNVAFKI